MLGKTMSTALEFLSAVESIRTLRALVVIPSPDGVSITPCWGRNLRARPPAELAKRRPGAA
jgi:hypothetical protein